MKYSIFLFTGLMLLSLVSCQNARQDAEKLHSETSQLLKMQKDFAEDSVFSKQELEKLSSQVNRLETLGKLLDEKYTGDERADFAPLLCEGSYDLLKTSENANYKIYFIHNASVYIRECEKLETVFPDISCWNELMQNMSFTTPKGKAFLAMAEQYMMVLCQIEASEDSVLTEKEIETIVSRFKTSMNTYEEMYNYFQDKPEALRAYDAQISGISLEFKHKNEHFAKRLEACENYEELNNAMYDVLMGGK